MEDRGRNPVIFIGLGHYSRVGKSTFSRKLQDYLTGKGLKVKEIPFAWKLKQIVYELYQWAGVREPEFYETEEGAPYRDIKIDALGMTPVELWVKFGTDAIRDQVYQNTWLDYVLKNPSDVDVVIIPDVRFPNEFEAILEAGGLLIKVVRPGFGPRPTSADQKLVGENRWHYVIGGENGLDELDEFARKVADHIAIGTELPPQSDEERRRQLDAEAIGKKCLQCGAIYQGKRLWCFECRLKACEEARRKSQEEIAEELMRIQLLQKSDERYRQNNWSLAL